LPAAKSFGPAADQAKQFTAGEVAQNTKAPRDLISDGVHPWSMPDELADCLFGQLT